MQKVNLKFYNFQIILFMFLFRARYMHRKYRFSKFVEMCFGVVV